MELLSSNIKYISGNGNREKNSLYIRKRKPSKLQIFWEMEPFSPSQEDFLCFRKHKPQKTFLIFSQEEAFLTF